MIPRETLVSDLWKRIIAWFSINVPANLCSFGQGVSEEELASAESKMRVRLPDDVRESYLLHNGMGRIDFFDAHKLLTLEEVVCAWKMSESALEYLELEGYENTIDSTSEDLVKNRMWNLLWIPIMGADEDKVLIDLDPGPSGIVGQLIETCGGPPLRLANSFRDFLSQYASDLESGKYRFDSQTWEISQIKE
jgi:cell wall assembly regulator SMI1